MGQFLRNRQVRVSPRSGRDWRNWPTQSQAIDQLHADAKRDEVRTSFKFSKRHWQSQWHAKAGQIYGGCFLEIFERLDRELWIVTARDGERHSGLVATYASRVSLVPALPRVTIALAKHHFTHELIEASGAFCMHLVGEEQIDWVWRFGIPSGRDVDKLSGLATSTGTSGAPILADALAWLDCRVEARMDTGDRTVYLAEVLDAGYGIQGTEGGDLRSGTVRGQETRAQLGQEARAQRAAPLTFKRLLELAPAERPQEMKRDMERDTEFDRAAILEWRRRFIITR